MAKRINRRLRKDFGRSGRNLPNDLSFLLNFPFFAVVEDRTKTRKQVRIEVTPRALKGLFKTIEDLKLQAKPNIEEKEGALLKIQALEKKVQRIENELLASQDTIHRLNAKVIAANLASPPNRADTSSGPMKGHLGLAADGPYKAKGKALQGGIPGLGKRR